jgi:hypothetical protein
MELSEKEKKAARAFARLGGLKGGKARAEAMTPEERSQQARDAAQARWAKRDVMHRDIPQAPHTAILTIGGVEIPCAVLDGGLRVLSERGVMKALGGSEEAPAGDA